MPENHNEHVLLKSNGSTDDPNVETGIIKPTSKWTKYQILHLAVTLLLLAICIALVGIYVIKISSLEKDNKQDTKSKENHAAGSTNEKTDVSKAPVCQSPECISVAAQVLSYANTKVNPCDNFYEYACGGWKKRAYIPDGKPMWDTFSELIEANDKLLKNRLEEHKPDNKSLAEVELYKLYASCKNTAAIDKLGLQPLKQLIRELGSCKVLNASWDAESWDLNEQLAKVHEVFEPITFFEMDTPLFDARVAIDITDSSNNIIKLSQPKRDFLPGNYELQAMSGPKKGFIFTIMEKLGGSNVNSSMKEVQKLEKELQEALMPKDKLRKVQDSRQKITIKNLIAATKNNKLDWLRYLKLATKKTGAKITESTKIATQPLEYLKKMTKIVSKTSKTTLANYFIWKVVKEYQAVYSKPSTQEPRWQSCMRNVETYMGMALGTIFVREKFKDSDKEKVEKMINSIKNSFLTIVNETSWMDAQTKRIAIKKGEAIIGNIAYPPFIKDATKLAKYYSGVSLKDDSYFNNILQLKRIGKNKNMMKLMLKVDRQAWDFPPTFVNAFYDTGRNKMVFMAAILQSPLFNKYAPMPINYGGIGAVMGHELSHGFDDQGRLYDEKGNLMEWWSEGSIKAYAKKVKCLKNQYSKYSLYNVSINVNNTIGENIADNSGMKTAFKAYRKWVAVNGPAKRLPGVEMTDDQLFFLASAQVWCSIEKKFAMILNMRQGTHSPSVFRVRGSLSNMKEFAEAYNCSADSAMNPKHKCSLW